MKRANTRRLLTQILCWGMAAGSWVLCVPAGAQADFDLSTFRVSGPNQGQQGRWGGAMAVGWKIGAESCHVGAGKEQNRLTLGQGCAVRDADLGQCTVFTTGRTTHSIVGHLIRFCLEGRS